MQVNFTQMVKRARKSNSDTGDLKEPTNFADVLVNMPTSLTETRVGGSFLSFAGFADDTTTKGLLVFCSDFGKYMLQNSKVWVSDGTFTLPKGTFHQLYVIHAQSADGVPYPCVYALLCDKSTVSYQKFFEIVKTIAPDGPEEVLIDLESAPINMYKHFWPDIVTEACEFHFKKALRDQLGKKGCLPLYNSNPRVQYAVDSFKALAFCPAEEIPKLFDECLESMFCKVVAELSPESEDDEEEENIAFDSANKTCNTGSPLELIQYFKYLEMYYIGSRFGMRGDKRKRPPYPPALWSKYNAVLGGRYRTSNVSKNWNSQIHSSINKLGTIWKFIPWISQEDCLMGQKFKKDTMAIQKDTPEGPLEGGSRRIVTKDRQERLKNVVTKFGLVPNKDYLEMVADLSKERYIN